MVKVLYADVTMRDCFCVPFFEVVVVDDLHVEVHVVKVPVVEVFVVEVLVVEVFVVEVLVVEDLVVEVLVVEVLSFDRRCNSWLFFG